MVAVTIMLLLFSSTRILGMLGGLGLAATVALPYKLGPLGVLSVLVGYVLSGFSTTNLYFFGATVAILLIKFICVKIKVKIQEPFILSTLTFISLFTISMIGFFVNNEPITTLIINLAQAVFAMTFTYYSFMFFRSFLSERAVEKYSKFESYSLIVIATILISTLSGYSFYSINLGYLVGGVIVICFMIKKGAVGGGISAILMGIGSLLYSTAHLEYAGVLIVCGFIGGVFYEWGKLPVLSAFTIIYTISVLVFISPTQLMSGALTILFSVLISIFLPDRYINLVTSIPTPASEQGKPRNDLIFKNNVSSKLNFASATINDLQRSLNLVGNSMKKNENCNINLVTKQVEEKVCARCNNRLSCYCNYYDDTTRSFSKVLSTLQRESTVDSTNVSDFLINNCKKLNPLIMCFNQEYQALQKNIQKYANAYNSRQLVSEQFRCISDLLSEIGQDLQDNSNLDDSLSANLSIALINNDISASQVSCFIDKNNRFYCDIYTYAENSIHIENLSSIVAEVSGKTLSLPTISTIAPYEKISFYEQSTLDLDLGVNQINYKDNTICGDKFESFTDSRGNIYLMLSDGMGKGRRAALDSTMTCSITQELIKAGFGYESALKILNSALNVKSSDESSATIDIAKINPYENKVEFIKAGAATSYLKSNDDVQKIQAFTLPIGMLQGIEYDKKTSVINSGDMIVIVSDGVNPISDEWVNQILIEHADDSANDIAKLIAQTAKLKGINEQDDITAIVCKVA